MLNVSLYLAIENIQHTKDLCGNSHCQPDRIKASLRRQTIGYISESVSTLLIEVGKPPLNETWLESGTEFKKKKPSKHWLYHSVFCMGQSTAGQFMLLLP